MLWKVIWVHPYTVMMVQGGGKFWKIGVRRSKNHFVVVGVYIVMVCQWTDHILARNSLLEVEADLP